MNNDPRDMDIITVQNADTNSIEIIYDGKSWGTLSPGQIRRMPRFLAEHVVKHLIDQILNRLEKPTNSLPLRKEWASKIVIDEEVAIQPRVLTEAEKLEKDLATLNHQSDLESVLNRHKAREAEALGLAPAPTPLDVIQDVPPALTPGVLPLSEVPVAPVTPVSPPPPQEGVVVQAVPVDAVNPLPTPAPVEPLVVAPVAPIAPLEPAANEELPVAPVQPIPVATDPTTPDRNTLYAWARDNMHMNIDEPKTRAALDSTPVEQLVDDLQYAPTL